MNAQTMVLARPRILEFVALTKLGITGMVGVTTALGFAIASGTGPVLLHVLVGTALVAAGANALNMLLEREADGKMPRTENRPLPAGRLTPAEALALGVVLSAVGTAYLIFLVNPLAASLAAISLGTYLFVYTPLKSRTSLSTFVGAVTGALPPMIGWAAAGNGLGTGAWVLFLILFFWQMPHFLAIAWKYRDDYASAGYRMLTVDDPDGSATGRQVIVQTLALLVVTVVPAITGMAGPIYLTGALALGAGFLAVGYLFSIRPTKLSARRLFLFSNLYLPALLILLAFGG